MFKHSHPMSQACFSQDNVLLAVAFNGSTGTVGGKPFQRKGRLQVWNLAAHKEIVDPIALPPSWINAVQFTDDGRRLVAAGPGVHIWDTATWQPIAESLHEDNVRQLAIGAGRVASATAVCGGRGEVRLWSAETG